MPMDVMCQQGLTATVSDEMGDMIARLALLDYGQPIKGKISAILWFDIKSPDVILFYEQNFADIVVNDSERKTFFNLDEAWDYICQWI